MTGLRYVLPVAIVLGGAIVMAFGSEIDLEGGAGIVSAGLAVWGMNWLYRASIDGDRVREAEEAARDYLDVHGHWPDEDVPLAASSSPSRQVSAAVTSDDAARPHAAASASRSHQSGSRPDAPSAPSPASAHQAEPERDLTVTPSHQALSHHSRPHTSGPSGRRPRG